MESYSPQDRWNIIDSSIFVEYALRVNDIFRFALSGSYDRQDGLSVVNESVKDKNQHIQGGSIQGIGYVTLGEYWLLHANVGHKSNMPPFRTLYGNYVTNLAPNNNNNGTPSQYCYQYQNAKNGWSVGAEASIKQGFWDDKLVLGANWTYIHRKSSITLRRGVGSKGGVREFTTHPRQNINFNILIAPVKYFDVNLMGSVQTSRWAYRSQYDDYVKLPTVFYFDLVANYYVTNAFKLTFGAYNLFDRNYNYNANATTASAGGLPGRRIFAGFEYRF